MRTSRCPRCGTQFIYWDDEDLDENGDLRCYCDIDTPTKEE
jgi:DNA-directed RNA polymerase subunit RPC12/RpoP